MRIYVFRHGNTFARGESPVWIGSREDLPLTAEGCAQGQRAGAWLSAHGVVPARVIAAPLKRTRQFAEILRAPRPNDPIIELDERLSELDYGTWGGRTTEEIADQVGSEVVNAWNLTGRWPPEGAGWGSKYPRCCAETHEFVRDLAFGRPAGDVVVVSSAGRIRLLLAVCSHRPLQESRLKGSKIRTGGLSIFEFRGGELFEVGWNLDTSS